MSNTTTRERTPGDTSKSKASLAKDLKVSLASLLPKTALWVPVFLDSETRQLLMDVAESRSTADHRLKVHAMIANMATDMIESKRTSFVKEAESVASKRAAEFTPEELVKEVAAAQRKLDRMTAALAASKKKA